MEPDSGVHRCKECGKVGSYSHNTGRAGKWSVMKDGDAGWFFQNNGEVYCPEHVPEWVPAWREKRAADKIRKAEEDERVVRYAKLARQESNHPVE